MSSTAYSILVVDDSPVCHKLIEHAVAEASYPLLFANNGEEGLRLFLRHSPAIVVTDWNMPDFSGLELCRRIRQQINCPYTYHHGYLQYGKRYGGRGPGRGRR